MILITNRMVAISVKKNLVIGYNYGASTITGPNVLVVRALNFTAFTWFILRNSV